MEIYQVITNMITSPVLLLAISVFITLKIAISFKNIMTGKTAPPPPTPHHLLTKFGVKFYEMVVIFNSNVLQKIFDFYLKIAGYK